MSAEAGNDMIVADRDSVIEFGRGDGNDTVWSPDGSTVHLGAGLPPDQMNHL